MNTTFSFFRKVHAFLLRSGYIWRAIPVIRSGTAMGALATLLLLSASMLPAQNSSTSSLAGAVTDPSGAVISGAVVTVRNLSTQVKHVTKTSAAGVFKILFLNPGLYSVTVEKPGFATVVDDNLHLELDQTGRFDTTMKVGSAKGEVVSVSSAVPLLDTDSSSVSTVFSEEMVHELPLVGRTPTQLAILAPGTSTTMSDKMGTGTGGSIDPGRVDVGGSRVFTIDATLDGAPMILPGDNNFGNMVPSMDAVSEFSVVQGNFGAQYGGGTSVLNIVLHNGTNQFHGSAFDFIQNDDLNAQYGFSGGKQRLRYNQFGGTIGGPILRNRLFAFFAYQNTRVPSSSPSIVTVPTDAEKAGDFSAICPTLNGAGQCTDNGVVTQIYNPVNGQPYANNQIPSSQFDSVAKNLLTYFPEPNYGANGALINNYFRLRPQTQQTPIYNGKLTWTITQKHTLAISVHNEPYSQAGEGQIPGPVCYGGGCGSSFTHDQLYQLTEQWVVTPHLVNSFAASVAHEAYGLAAPSQDGNYPSKLGLTQNISQVYFPSFSWTGNAAFPGTSVGPGS